MSEIMDLDRYGAIWQFTMIYVERKLGFSCKLGILTTNIVC